MQTTTTTQQLERPQEKGESERKLSQNRKTFVGNSEEKKAFDIVVDDEGASHQS